MNQSIESEHVYLRPVDILIPNIDFQFAGLLLFFFGYVLNFLIICSSLGLKLKLFFIYSEAIETLRSYKNTTTIWFPLLTSRPDIPELGPVIENTLVMFLLFFLLATFRVMYYFHRQIMDLLTRFLISVFDLDNLDYFFDIYINDSGSDDSDDDDDNDDNGIHHNNYRYPDDEEYEGDYEDNEGNDEFDLLEYVLRFVYNDRMSTGFYGEFLAFNGYPEYDNYSANSDDEISSDADTDDDGNDDLTNYYYEYSDLTYTPTAITSVFGNNNNTI